MTDFRTPKNWPILFSFRMQQMHPHEPYEMRSHHSLRSEIILFEMNLASRRSTSLFPTTRRGLVLVMFLTLGAGLLHIFADSLGEPRRWILALMTVGLFAAPESRTRLSFPIWLASTGLVAWSGRYAEDQGVVLLLLVAFFGAALLIRGGERAASYYLPEVTEDLDNARRTTIRRYLQASIAIFVVVFLIDGYLRSGLLDDTASILFLRLVLLFSSAASFIRYVVEQSRGQRLERVPAGQLVSSQRWTYLILLGPLLLTPLPHLLLARLGKQSDRTLFMTSGFLMLLATAFFVAALIRLGRAGHWSRRATRWSSFLAGVFLAQSLFAYMVDLGYRIDPVGGGAMTPRAVQGIKTVHIFIVTLFLVVLPFVHEKTSLLRRYPKPSFFIAPPVLAVMSAPLVAINGDRWDLASTGFLYFLALFILFHYLWDGLGQERRETVYFTAVLVLLLTAGTLDAISSQTMHSIIKLFVISVSFVLYGVDLYDRAGERTA